MDGVSVIRVPLYPSHDRSSFRRILNYISFSFFAAIMGPFLVKKADVAYVYHPPATVALPAIVLKFLRGIPFVYDIQDLWPDTLAATGMMNNRFLFSVVNIWCDFLYRSADHLVVLSPGFKRVLQLRNVPADKVTVIYNWCDESSLIANRSVGSGAREICMAGRFNVVFAGTMGKAQGMDAILAAAKIISKRHPKVQFVLVGSGIEVDSLKLKVKEGDINNVVFLPRRPINEIGTVLSAADLLLVHLKNDKLFSITIPSKVQAYMAVGRPILLAVQGDAATLVEKSGAGLICEPESPESIACAVEKFFLMPADKRKSMGESGRLFYERELSLQIGVQQFETVFSEVAGSA